VRRVSLAAVRALCAPSDPQTPPDARLVYEVAQAVGLDRDRIRVWAQRGLLPSWQGRHGMLVRVADVRALAQPPAPEGGPPMPTDARLIREAVRLAGVSRNQVYSWITRGLLPVWPASGSRRRVRLADVLALAELSRRSLPLTPQREP